MVKISYKPVSERNKTIMKSRIQNAFLLSITATILLAGCNKEAETAAPTATPETVDPLTAVAEKVEETANSVKEMATPAKEAAQSVQTEGEQAKEAVTEAVSEGKKNALQIIESVKELVGQAKYTEALAAISELSIDQLSPDLQQVVNGLKEKAEKALASTAAGKAGETINNVLKENNIKLENPFKK